LSSRLSLFLFFAVAPRPTTHMWVPSFIFVPFSSSARVPFPSTPAQSALFPRPSYDHLISPSCPDWKKGNAEFLFPPSAALSYLFSPSLFFFFNPSTPTCPKTRTSFAPLFSCGFVFVFSVNLFPIRLFFCLKHLLSLSTTPLLWVYLLAAFAFVFFFFFVSRFFFEDFESPSPRFDMSQYLLSFCGLTCVALFRRFGGPQNLCILGVLT